MGHCFAGTVCTRAMHVPLSINESKTALLQYSKLPLKLHCSQTTRVPMDKQGYVDNKKHVAHIPHAYPQGTLAMFSPSGLTRFACLMR